MINGVDEYFALLKAELQSYDPALVAGFIAGAVVFIVELILNGKGVFSSGKKRKEEAIRKGNVITAHQTSIRFRTKTNEAGKTEYIWTASYEYEFNGRKGKKTVVSQNGRPGTTMMLYHDGKKVYRDGQVNDYWKSLLFLGIPICVMIVVALLLGYRP